MPKLLNLNFRLVLCGAFVFLLSQRSFAQRSDIAVRSYASLLWYTNPARNWNEALPIGNGRMGAMVYGRVKNEHIQLNEQTLWSGAPRNWNNPEAQKYLQLVRKAALNGNYRLADSLSKHMQGPYTESYMPMADLFIRYKNINDSTSYIRSLNLDSAIAKVQFNDGRKAYSRTCFASFPDKVIVIHNTCSKRASISFNANISSKLHFKIYRVSSNQLILKGKCPQHVDPVYLYRVKDSQAIQYAKNDRGEGMTFEVSLLIKNIGGKVECDTKTITVENADEVTIILSAATSYNGYNKSPGLQGKDPFIAVKKRNLAVNSKSFAHLLQAHVNDYQPLYQRFQLNLGQSDNQQKATDDRLRLMDTYTDPELVATIVQYGRYLLIAGSRPGGLPVNLKGIWNDRLRPEYSSNWCIDHDAQMFYYPVETTNLSEINTPFLDFINDLSKNGAVTARVNYGMNGWCAHHNTDIWRQTGPVGNYGDGNPHWATWNMSGSWLCASLYDHYLFTGGETFLRNRAWPVMKGAAIFCLNWLIKNKEGKLISVPSVSPENTFITDKGDTAEISISTTGDIALMKQLFNNCIAASRVLHTDKKFSETLTRALSELMPYQIGSKGELQEWFKDWRPVDPSHRHLTHMYPVFPGNEISIYDTPGLAVAAKIALEMRTKTNCTWGFPLKAACWARLDEPDSAWTTWENQLRYVDPYSKSSKDNYGLFPNLFNSDGADVIMNGNGCATAVMTEMLVQSRQSEIDVLPALPRVFPKGSVKGLCTRGGFTIDFSWKDNLLEKGLIYSKLGRTCNVRVKNKIKVYHGQHEIPVKLIGENFYSFKTEKGEKYALAGLADIIKPAKQ